ncbi:MAG TPA: hypothetical protein VFK30_00460, partial [Anaerolineae bacterium]|nr:hypothetical protein [Anaerolineae bacterium]
MSQLSAAFSERLAAQSGPEQFQTDEIANLTAAQIKRKINRWIFKETGGTVQGGPFAGMKLLQEPSWNWNDDLSTQLIGCYEQELHHYIELEIYRLGCLPNPKIVNIGSAEGYYAIGMARRLPLASVWIVDVSEAALKCAEKIAAANDVTLHARNPIEMVLAGPDLVICDCEGAET